MRRWLRSILRRTRPDASGASVLAFECGWEVSATEAPTEFLRALPLVAGIGAVVYFEGTREEHVRHELARLQVPAQAHIKRGTIWPKPDQYHLPLTPELAEDLASFLDTHPTDYFCTHCHVYRAQEILLRWYDSFSDPIYLAASIDAAQARAFARALGSSCNGLNETPLLEQRSDQPTGYMRRRRPRWQAPVAGAIVLGLLGLRAAYGIERAVTVGWLAGWVGAGLLIGLLVALVDRPGPVTLLSRFLALISPVVTFLPIIGPVLTAAAYFSNRANPGAYRTLSAIAFVASLALTVVFGVALLLSSS